MKITHGKFTIEFDYSPSEQESEWYPGREEEVEVLSVMIGEFDLLDELPYCAYESLRDWAEEKAWDHIRDDIVGFGD